MILGFLKGFSVNGKRKPTDFELKIKTGIKIHTIRADVNKRWKRGRKIHYATGVRSSNYNCFKEGVCSGSQKIEIFDRIVFIDNIRLSNELVELLACNDGFDSIDDFWGWFDSYSPFEGVIIHWTNFRYFMTYEAALNNQDI